MPEHELTITGSRCIRRSFYGRPYCKEGAFACWKLLWEIKGIQAYILGQNDDNYRKMVKATHAILFLSTPHRGTNLADVLNKILMVSIFNHTPKLYIAELRRNSPTLEDINEQFRHIAPSLQIISFYETLPTPIGPSSIVR